MIRPLGSKAATGNVNNTEISLMSENRVGSATAVPSSPCCRLRLLPRGSRSHVSGLSRRAGMSFQQKYWLFTAVREPDFKAPVARDGLVFYVRMRFDTYSMTGRPLVTPHVLNRSARSCRSCVTVPNPGTGVSVQAVDCCHAHFDPMSLATAWLRER
jgi:hypothetical protein